LREGDIEAAWGELSLMQKRAILEGCRRRPYAADQGVGKGLRPDGVRIDWKVS
jgi:hypothetical protein